ncbi:GumC family protein [Flavobacterium sp. ARAG 55.4]|uniref:GumC family protein n=1 Tax=Flavobacterium sp. ARAG 55.4 TaxID=3451357 RepID=UPI003F478E3D
MDVKKQFLKYVQYWPWFLASFILFTAAAYYYLGAVSPTYETSALINIDKMSEKDSEIISTDKVKTDKEEDLEKEKVFITSNDFLSKLVSDLKLNINYYEKGFIDNKVILDIPFVFKTHISNDSLSKITYNIKVTEDGFFVNESVSDGLSLVRNKTVYDISGVPFSIELTSKAKKNLSNYLDKEYVVTVEPTELAVKKLKLNLEIASDENLKTNLSLKHTGTNPMQSKRILNKLIESLDEDIFAEKQKKLGKTVAYLNQRIAAFTKEKDSIESIKESYLRNNNIYVLDQYIATKTNEKTAKTANSALNDRQISLTTFAINDIKRAGNSPLGTDYNLDLPSLSQMLINYNSSLAESELILQRAQKNNPAYLSLAAQLQVQKQSILSTLGDYLNQLKQTRIVNRIEQSNAISEAKSIPTKNKELGNIDNDLSLKEETYLALLQKREEAVLNGAVLDSNLSVLDFPQTNYSAISPKPKPFMLGTILFSLLLPFGIVYVKLKMDSRIHTQEDLNGQLADIPFLGNIPEIDANEKLDNTATSRSVIAEATRTLFSNITYLLPHSKDQLGKVLLFTSSIQGEGKSFCAFHNAVTISNLNKKVLLIGADLRNPQLHDYYNVQKSIPGLSDFLYNSSQSWKNFLVKKSDFSENLDVLFSGEIPPNPSQLLTNSNFEILLQEAKSFYDFIIIDSAPVQIVSDTLNFSYLADVTIYVAKSNFSEKSNLLQLNDFIKKGQLKNVGVIINGISKKSAYGYSYNYSYQEKKVKAPWFKRSMAFNN